MWRHLVAVGAAVMITLVILEFWGNFSGAMTQFVKVKAAHDQANTPIPVSMVPAAAPPRCGKKQPCPQLPNEKP